MKAIVPATFLALVVGFLAGGLLKDGGAGPRKVAGPAESMPSKAAERDQGSSSGGDAGVESRAGKSLIRPQLEKQDQAAALAADDISKRLVESLEGQNAKRAESRALELAAKLGLDDAQTGKLREFLMKRSTGGGFSLDGGGQGLRLEKTEGGESMDDFMKELLTTEQGDAYAALKETERDQRIEARTLREMASVTQAVAIRDEQRDAVYAALQEEAGNAASGEGPQDIMAGLGELAMAGPEGVLAGAVSIKLAPGDDTPDGEDVMKSLRNQEKARIEGKVNRFNGIFDEAQLSAYRSYLEGRSILPGE